jgi:hypothetical protein
MGVDCSLLMKHALESCGERKIDWLMAAIHLTQRSYLAPVQSQSLSLVPDVACRRQRPGTRTTEAADSKNQLTVLRKR